MKSTITSVDRRWRRGLSLLAAVGAFGFSVYSSLASATPIGPNCAGDTCNGGIYTLTSTGLDIGSSAAQDTFRVTLTANTAGIPTSLNSQDGPGTGPYFIDAAAIKVSASAVSASIFDAPDSSGNQGGASNWSIVDGGIGAGGCSGSGGGFECADWVTVGFAGAPVDTADDLMSWTFDITMATGAFFGLEGTSGATQASIKMHFVNSAGEKVGALLSENIWIQSSSSSSSSSNGGPGSSSGGFIPEPDGLSLMGIGLIGAAVSLGMRRKKLA